MSDEPKPVDGALAGGFVAAVSIVVFTALIGLMASITDSSAGTLGGAVSEFISFAVFFVVYGGLVTLPLIIPRASVGYGYEWYLTGV
jgi:uncharacterized BrkB/YihY/UPF0761 family membrane protein